MSDSTIAPKEAPTNIAAVEREGDSIGPFHLLQVIGEGGFGIVWLAERRGDFTQRVALKVIKPGMDSRAVIARFEQERQALAVMDHPNVAKVLDGGLTALGRPYFVMEHVQGEPITAYCDRHRLTIRERLELFIPVCEAVQHAHMKGIIHRDLKPSNVLVAIADSRAIPKVIDFGVAKAVASTLTEKTIFTERGQLIGTPEYMSPEQAEMGALDIDTRSDVYSLGVVLYELIAGMLPFDSGTLRAAGYDAIRRIIREEDAPKPSTRLSTMDDKSAATIAHTRQSRREDLAGQLRRELDWIPLKAIRKQRTERYATPADLARDIKRYLNNETLEAGPESAAYRVRKMVRRHRGPVLAGSLILVTLVAGVAASTAGFLRASDKAKEAQREFTAARAAESVARTAEVAAKTSEAAAVKSFREARVSAYAANIALARSAIDNRDLAAAREALNTCPTDLRAWEWSLLNSAVSHSIGGFTAHSGMIRHLAFSPDGVKLATCSADGTARIWDYLSGDLLADLDTSRSPVNGIVWSPDGARVATATADGRVRTWSAQGVALGGTPAGEDAPTYLAWSPAGGHIAALYWSGRAGIFDPQTLERTHSIEAHEGLPAQLCFSSDGQRLYTSGWFDHRVKCFDPGTGAAIWNVNTGINVTALAAARSGTALVGTNFWWPFTLDPLSPRQADFLKDPGRATDALSIAVSPDGATLVTGSRTTVVAWDLKERRVLNNKPVEYTWSPQVAVHPSGAVLARGDDRGRVRFWSVATPFSFPMRTHPVTKVTFNDRVIATALNAGLVSYTQANGTVEVVNLDDPQRRTSVPSNHGKVLGAALTPDGGRLVTAAADGKVIVRDAPFAEVAREFDVGRTPGPVAIASDGSLIVVGCQDGVIALLGYAGEPARTLSGHSGPVYALAISPDGRRVVSAGYDMSVRLWDLGTLRQLASIAPHKRPAVDVAFSADGARIATASMDSTALILDSTTLGVLTTLRGHLQEVTSVAFSADGLRVATGSWDDTVRLWAADSGAEVFRIQLTDPHKLAFAPDGSRLAGVGSNNIFEWQAATHADRVAIARLPEARAELEGGSGMRRVYDRLLASKTDGKASDETWWFKVVQNMQRRLSDEAEAAAKEVMGRAFGSEDEVDAAVTRLASDAAIRPEIRSRAARLVRDGLLSPAVRSLRLRKQLLTPGSADQARLLRLAEELYASAANTENLVLRGLARFRAGRAEGAAADLAAASQQRRGVAVSIIDIGIAERNRERPVELAFLAMALRAAGRADEAGKAMDSLQRAMSAVPDSDKESQAAYDEARKAFGR